MPVATGSQPTSLNSGEIGPDEPYPVVLYTGRWPWRGGTSLRERQGELPTALHRFNPALEFLLIDLNTIDPEALRGVGNACAVFFQMALVSDARALPALAETLNGLLPGEDHETLRQALAQWVVQVRVPSLGGRIDDALQQAKTLSEVGAMLAERAPHWLAEARRKGREEGGEEGVLAGQSKMLQTLLRTRFGPELPIWVEARLQSATDEDLPNWARAMLRAESLEAVFDSGSAR